MQHQRCRTFRGAGALTAFTAVKMTTAVSGEETVTVAGDGDLAIGILQEDVVAAGDSANVCVAGESFALANAAITVGVLVQSVASTGKIGAAAATEYVFGYALEAADAQDNKIKVWITGPATM